MASQPLNLFFSALTVVVTFSASALPETAYRTYAQSYKDAALAFCIATAYKADEHASTDAAASARGIDNWGQYDLEESTGKVPELIDKYLAREYHSKHSREIKLDLMKCMDMYHGAELEALVKQYVEHPDRTYAQDELSR
ncbi:type VI secretion system amidase immunity protein Tai4 [Erwiniaceae bacterium BAC15a-03b]|uniref:Type VI secretion system amidase immunity protein Tai4 n=1 Tax=Winslowiella arboricola TaxID=2978220 RepID=A0A9J6PJV5_9GAMM|nr:T6SS amidase immunity protein Tai4 family protein [Winslowiella arboricola]MCU5774045.1 type VI secretion system amidase immunity protein Tai4 [Winslowiella arboricola]MCU5777022.1 type VI secretion system amidase immunity protein Tai4 [Winslowiella arboricola]